MKLPPSALTVCTTAVVSTPPVMAHMVPVLKDGQISPGCGGDGSDTLRILGHYRSAHDRLARLFRSVRVRRRRLLCEPCERCQRLPWLFI
jgi:hypothetical protein